MPHREVAVLPVTVAFAALVTVTIVTIALSSSSSWALPAASAVPVLQAHSGNVRVADFSGAGQQACVAQLCTPGCPCASLQDALNAAQDYDTIWLVPPADGSAIPCESAVTNKSVTVAAAPWRLREVVLDCGGQGRALWFVGWLRAELGRAVLANVTVRNGFGDIGGCVRADDMALEVLGCRLEECRAAELGGGVAQLFHRPAAAPPGRVAQVTVAHSELTACRATKFGGGLAVMFLASAAEAVVSVQGCQFSGSQAYLGGGMAVVFSNDSLSSTVSVSGSSFSRCEAGNEGGGLLAWFLGDATRSTVRVSDCRFTHTSAVSFGGGAEVWFKAADSSMSVVFVRTTFLGAAAGYYGGALLTWASSASSNASITITDCTFWHNYAVLAGGSVMLYFDLDTFDPLLLIERCDFIGSSAGYGGGAVAVYVGGTATGVHAAFRHCAFQDCRADVEGGAMLFMAEIAGSSAFVAHVSTCRFVNCTAVNRAGAVRAMLFRKQATLPAVGCNGNFDAQERTWAVSSQLIMQDCSLQHVSCSSAACEGGAIAVRNGMLQFLSSNASTVSASAAGGFLHTSGTAGVAIVNSRVQHASARENAFIAHEGQGMLDIHSSQLAVPLHGEMQYTSIVSAPSASRPPAVTAGSLLLCNQGETFGDASPGAQQTVEIWDATCRYADDSEVFNKLPVRIQFADVRWQCVPCARGSYFLGAGFMNDTSVITGSCAPCPFGAECLGGADVRAHPGMWATTFPNATGNATWLMLPDTLLRCADGYCCRDRASCRRFDTCAANRTGVLCGQCEGGTVGVLGSTACRAEADCGQQWQDVLFWPGTVLGMLGFLTWQVRAIRLQMTSGRGRSVTFRVAGVMKASFAFFQCFPLLLPSHRASDSAMRSLYVAALSLFSFQINAGNGVCILGGLTPVGEQLVKVALVVLMVACGLPTVWVLHGLAGWFGPKWLPVHPPSRPAYAGALTAVVLLTYSVVVNAVLKLVACVPVTGLGQRLLIQGNVACWTGEAWWQWLVAAWGLCNTLFAPLSLVVGGWLLRCNCISMRWFWVSLLLPLPCLVAWCVGGHVQRAWQERGTGSDIGKAQSRTQSPPMVALCAGYRAEVWWWDAVLLLRRLVLSLLPLLLQHSVALRAMMAQVTVLVFFMAHLCMWPFAALEANVLEAGYLFALTCLSGLSVWSGALLTESVQSNSHSDFMSGSVVVLLLAAPAPGLLHFARRQLMLAQLDRARRRESRVWQMELPSLVSTPSSLSAAGSKRTLEV